MKPLQLGLMCITLLSGLYGCGSYIPFVHRPDIQQGNILEEKQVNAVEIGMTREQVEYLLGAPLSHDSFADYRYDYVYYLKANHKAPVYRHVTIWFTENWTVSKVVKNLAQEQPAK